MADDALLSSLQESILAAMIWHDVGGAVIAAQLEAADFDDQYHDLAERVLNYLKTYGRAPGNAHIDDICGKALTDNRSHMRRIIIGLHELAEGLNVEYVMSRVGEHKHRQVIKRALMQASERYEQGGDDMIPEVEATLYEALRHSTSKLNPGTFLNAPAALSFFDTMDQGTPLGIKELDELGIAMVPKEMLLFIGPKGTGKTWFGIHCGKQVFKHGGRVVHITLEVREEIVVMRYYQSLFAAARWPEVTDRTVLEFDELGKLAGWDQQAFDPDLVYSDPAARKAVRSKQQQFGTKLGNLVVKEFPPRRLTVPHLIGYLDYLEMVHKFIPTVLVVDYPDLLKTDPRNPRTSLGMAYQDLRGLAVERNMAIVTPTQGNRSSLNARFVDSDMVAEDVSKIQTADNTITYSQTEAEEALGLARLYVAHARNTKGGVAVLISQHYDTGQFVTLREDGSSASARLSDQYWGWLKEHRPDGVRDEDSGRRRGLIEDGDTEYRH